MIKDRDQARQMIASANVTTSNITEDSLKQLHSHLDEALQSSGLHEGTYEMNDYLGTRMTCQCRLWFEREAITFHDDGFIGIAGWADDTNLQPILNGIENWLNEYKGH